MIDCFSEAKNICKLYGRAAVHILGFLHADMMAVRL